MSNISGEQIVEFIKKQEGSYEKIRVKVEEEFGERGRIIAVLYHLKLRRGEMGLYESVLTDAGLSPDLVLQITGHARTAREFPRAIKEAFDLLVKENVCPQVFVAEENREKDHRCSLKHRIPKGAAT